MLLASKPIGGRLGDRCVIGEFIKAYKENSEIIVTRELIKITDDKEELLKREELLRFSISE